MEPGNTNRVVLSYTKYIYESKVKSGHNFFEITVRKHFIYRILAR